MENKVNAESISINIFVYLMPISMGNVRHPPDSSPAISSISFTISLINVVIKAKKAKPKVQNQAVEQASLFIIVFPYTLSSDANSRETTTMATNAVRLETTKLPINPCFLNVVE